VTTLPPIGINLSHDRQNFPARSDVLITMRIELLFALANVPALWLVHRDLTRRVPPLRRRFARH
jgi:hypothetical protein